ncbi:MAG: hypothetical protein R2838_10730 [Caldilineaceae bacterium]
MPAVLAAQTVVAVPTMCPICGRSSWSRWPVAYALDRAPVQEGDVALIVARAVGMLFVPLLRDPQRHGHRRRYPQPLSQAAVGGHGAARRRYRCRGTQRTGAAKDGAPTWSSSRR